MRPETGLETVQEEVVNVRDGVVEGPELPPAASAGMLALPAPPEYPDLSINLPTPNADNQNLDENGHRFVGLVNQAMTCYLNSLIQTLYMVPEFRNIIYKIERKNNARDIAFQLQKLFLQLQTSEKLSLETVDLTGSFGWESEVYDQHDVQELCWLMVEALEKRWANTSWKGAIENLFKGDVVDYVKCLNCKTVKSRNDMFLDLSLAVREDGSLQSHRNLQEALQAYIKPELLDGNNQYKCEKCDSLQDAQKGLGITKFPYLLCVQLKRFSFDYNTMHRIKLNDRKAPPTPPPEPEHKDEEDWLNVGPNAESVAEMLKSGPYVYELFSVMVHQGSATGGHYYAYIKNLDQQKWMCFNDSNVQFATPTEVQRTFGGSFSYGGMNNSNAYLLMYRQIDSTKNEHFIRTTDLPPHVADLKTKLEEEQREKEERRAQQRAMVKVNVICNDFQYINNEPKNIQIHKEIPLDQIKERILCMYPDVKRESRLVTCEPSWHMKSELSQAEGGKGPLTAFTSRWGYSPAETYIMVDTKERSHFYDIPDCADCMTAEVWLVDLDRTEVFAVKRVAFDPSNTVDELRGHLCAVSQIGLSNPLGLRIVYSPSGEDTQPMRLLDEKDVPVKSYLRSQKHNPQFYVDVGSTENLDKDRALDFRKTVMFRLLDSHVFKMPLTLHLPSLNDYCRVGLYPPIMCRNGARSPISSPFAIHRGEGKPFNLGDINEDTCSSNTPCPSVNGQTPEQEVFANWDSAVNTLQIVSPAKPEPQSPHSSLTPKEVKDGSSSSTPLSASSTYSSAPSSVNVFPEDKGGSRNTSKGSNDEDVVMGDKPDKCDPLMTESQPGSVPPPPPPPPPSYESIVDDTVPNYGYISANMELDPPSYNDVVRQTFPAVSDDQQMLVGDPLVDQDGYLTTQQDSDNASLSGNYTPCDSPKVFDSDEENGNEEVPYEMVSPGEPSSSREPCIYADVVSDWKFAIEIKDKHFTDNGSEVLTLNVDKRLTVKRFQEWVAQHINMKTNTFEFFKFHSDESTGYAVRINQTDTIRDVMRELHRVEVRPRLWTRNGESVVGIHQYIPGEPNLDKRAVLFDVAYMGEAQVEQLLLKCQALLKEVYSEEYCLKHLRLRELNNDSAPLLSNGSVLQFAGDKKLYLQVIDDKFSVDCVSNVTEEDERLMTVIMVQRWCPSTFEVMPLFELFIPIRDHESFEKSFKPMVSERSGIPVDRIEFSKPQPADDSYHRYPFQKPISELIDNVEFEATLWNGNFNGKLVYIRDAAEEKKVPSEEEKRRIRNRDHVQLQKQTANTFRRMERPLRIQVASISESEP